MRRPFIAGNWKMNKDRAGARQLAAALKGGAGDRDDLDVCVFPPFVYLPDVVDALAGSRVLVGAQNMHAEPGGAYTGEIAGPMIRDVGATHVLLGHSERRQYFGETDAGVHAKLRAALDCGLSPVVCVGETLDQREAGKMEDVVRTQVSGALGDLGADALGELVLAYEPVWAIGTGVTATPDQAQEAHAFIRGLLAELRGETFADAVRIQYGGSVKPGNAADLLGQPDIDGALVGGASLEAESFLAVINNKEA
jgi:triosephosphate isomerase